MAGKHKFKISKGKLFTAVGVVLALAAAVGAGVLFRWFQPGQKVEAPAPFAKDAEVNLPQSVTQAQDLALQGKVDQSNQTIQNALSQPNVSSSDKYDLLIQEGVNYSNSGNYQKALDLFKQADAVQSTFTTSHLIGEQAEALGDKQTAITYYKKAITQLDPNAISYNMDKTTYQDKIKALGGTP